MAICTQSSGLFWLFSVHTVLIFCVSWPGTETLRFPQHYTMMHWASCIEKELDKVLPQVTGVHQLKAIYNEKRSQFDVKRNSPKDLVDRVAKDIAKLLNSKRKALEEKSCRYHVSDRMKSSVVLNICYT